MTFIPKDSISRAGTGNVYRDIGIREGNVISMALDYGVSPANGKGCVIVRLLRRVEPETPEVDLTALSVRENGGIYRFISDEGSGSAFKAQRLNKTVIEVFAKENLPSSTLVGGFFLKLGADEAIAEWLANLLTIEGFDFGVMPTLVSTVRQLLGITVTEPPTLALVYPDLAKEAAVNKGKSEAMTAVNKYAPSSTDDDDDDADESSKNDDDDDEDEDYLLN